MNSDVIIVGGGVIGLSLAWRLLQEGAIVRVIDGGEALPSSTSAAAGMLAPSFENDVNTSARDTASGEACSETANALYRCGVESLERWTGFACRLEEESGQSIDFQTGGIIGAAFDEEEAGNLRRAFLQLQSLGADVIWHDRKNIRALEPALGDHVLCGFLSRKDGQVDTRRLTAALKTAIAKRGGEIITGETVRSINHDGVRVTGVLTDRETTYGAPLVAIAAGAMLAAIDLGAPPPPVFPVKGEALAVDMGSGANRTGGAPRKIVRTSRVYFCPKADGRLVIGATEKPRENSREISNTAIKELRAAAVFAAPVIGEFPEIERWAGFRPGTPDGAPLLGRPGAGPDGLVYAAGHYRSGILLAPATADLLCDLMLNDADRANCVAIPNSFRPDRFGG